MALFGSITNQGSLQGQITNANGYLTGYISNASSLGGQVVGMRGLKGDKGDTGDTGATGADGQDGYSPSATVSKTGHTATITITDKDGTTTASISDGNDGALIAEYGVTPFAQILGAYNSEKIVYLQKSYGTMFAYYPVCLAPASVGLTRFKMSYISGNRTIQCVYVDEDESWSVQTYDLQEPLSSGTNIKTINNESLLGSGNIDIQSGGASAFIAEYGVTTYADVKDAYDEDAIILCTVDDSGNTVICQLAYYDDENESFYFSQPQSDGAYWAGILSDDTWVDGYFQFASTDTATQLRDGLMTALDKQKLDGIASGAEVNVQSDWNEADNTKDDFIKNKPTIPTKVSDLNNDSGFITTETDPTVPSWAKQSTKPTYTATEVGALPNTTVIPSKTSDLNNDSGFTTKNIWYATCSTSASTQAKVATTDSQDFVLETGSMVRVKFEYANTYNGTATLNVDNTGAKDIVRVGTLKTTRYYWTGGEVVDIVYDGTNYVMSAKGTATTSQYGLTKLSNSTSSTSEALAATPKAVKAAYDEATDATEIPTREKKSKFDTDGHMNSTDMTSQDVSDFVDGLNVSGGGVEHISVATNVDAYKIGAVVTVFFTGATTTSTTDRTTFGTLPVGWRPQHLAINGNISGNSGYGCVSELGDVQAFRSTTGRIDVTVTYIATA